MRFHTPSAANHGFAFVLSLSLAASSITPILAADPQAATPSVNVGQTKDLVEQWKQELADAKLRRSKGRHLEVGGFLIVLGGDLLAATIVEHCHAGGCAAAPLVGAAGVAGGLTMGLVGRAQVHDANVEIGALITRGPAMPPSVAIPIGGTSSPISVTVGRTTGVTWRVRW